MSGNLSRTSAAVRSKGASAGSPRRVTKGGQTILPRAEPDTECAFCSGDSSRNRDGRAEPMLACWECGSAGHPTCLGIDDFKLFTRMQSYPWLCVECKRCEICDEKGNDDDIMFCDTCDRGWHASCLDPPLAAPPRGRFICPTCRKPSVFAVDEQLPTSRRRTTSSASLVPASSPPASSSRVATTRSSARSRLAASSAQGPAPAEAAPASEPFSFAALSSSVAGPSTALRTRTSVVAPTPSTWTPDAPAAIKKLILKVPRVHRTGGVSASGSAAAATSSIKRKGKMRQLNSDEEEDTVFVDGAEDDDDVELATDDPATPANEGEDDEPAIEDTLPYGGIIAGADAEQGDRKPGGEDRKRFDAARRAAEKDAVQAFIAARDQARERVAQDLERRKAEEAREASKRKKEEEALAKELFEVNGFASGSGAATPNEQLETRPALAVRVSQRERVPSARATGSPAPSGALSAARAGTPVASTSAAGDTSTPAPKSNKSRAASSAALLEQQQQLNGPVTYDTIPVANIQRIRFGEYEIDTWYQAPYPEEISRVPDGTLHICEFCFKYMRGAFQAERHKLKCKARCPPGDEIYRDGAISVFEIDGRKNKIYCQNLCLLAKMFLDHKTLYYDVEPFLFYVMTIADAPTGAKFVGYFSKEKRSPTNNVSCIMTLPVRQRKGWGNLLIDFSYLLSKKEGRVGTPERPLSELGMLSYRNYWTLVVFEYLAKHANPEDVTFEEVSANTALTCEDVYFVLNERGMIKDVTEAARAPSPQASDSTPSQRTRGHSWISRKRTRNRFATATVAGSSARQPHEEDPDSPPAVELPKKYQIIFDRPLVAAHLAKWAKKDYLKLRPERLKWSPFLVTHGHTIAVNGGPEIPKPSSEESAQGLVPPGHGLFVGNQPAASPEDEEDEEDELEGDAEPIGAPTTDAGAASPGTLAKTSVPAADDEAPPLPNGHVDADGDATMEAAEEVVEETEQEEAEQDAFVDEAPAQLSDSEYDDPEDEEEAMRRKGSRRSPRKQASATPMLRKRRRVADSDDDDDEEASAMRNGTLPSSKRPTRRGSRLLNGLETPIPGDLSRRRTRSNDKPQTNGHAGEDIDAEGESDE